ncbi:hypothetical protein [Rhodospirillum sp. A1_3_36]|uniref:hypothetical protein n=1 Tax=Rhodospirillum sp. A1_3_36 TaxID=3391666 RepID=UPI0039A70A3E
MNNFHTEKEMRPVDADLIRKQVIVDVVRARLRQVTELGFDAEHDDDHTDGELALAAICHALPATHKHLRIGGDGQPIALALWPFPLSELKEMEEETALVEAAATLIAEIERRYRAKERVEKERTNG